MLYFTFVYMLIYVRSLLIILLYPLSLQFNIKIVKTYQKPAMQSAEGSQQDKCSLQRLFFLTCTSFNLELLQMIKAKALDSLYPEMR